MDRVLLLRFGEIYLKGKNKATFEKQLMDNIKGALVGIPCKLKKTQGRYILDEISELDFNAAVSKVKNVFGLHSVSISYRVITDIALIGQTVLSLVPNQGTFRVTVNRADKTLPQNSQDIARELGYMVLTAKPALKVDLFHAQHEIFIDIREDKRTYIYMDKIMCRGGMPVGSSGKGIALLSGGIDSPVACYRMCKRGLKLDALHFHSFPYTSQMAKEKVIQLAQLLSEYQGSFRLQILSFTEIQQQIHEKCPAEFMITIMRRIMMRIAEILAKQNGCGSIITGESLAQVASQTQESILVTNSVVTLPVFRPLIGMDKEEIIRTARDIGTFETSILPYEDCCTVFLPKFPVIKPKLEVIEKAESALDVDSLIEKALSSVEVIEIKPNRS